MSVEFTKAIRANLRSVFGGESFVQKLLSEDPSLLGLGNLILAGKEQKQLNAGRVDLVFETQDAKRRFEVEVQLGATDETHIIRTIEYWDNERRRYPEKEHVAVIIAEQITSRFFNVIQLFNRQMPMIAIQMSALIVGSHNTIQFTKVLDHATRTEKQEDEYQPTDRNYWVKRTSEPVMQMIDQIYSFANEVDPQAVLKYNKGYVTIKRTVGGSQNNFISLRPQKKITLVWLASCDPQLEAAFLEAGLQLEPDYVEQRFALYLTPEDFKLNMPLVKQAIQQSYQSSASEE